MPNTNPFDLDLEALKDLIVDLEYILDYQAVASFKGVIAQTIGVLKALPLASGVPEAEAVRYAARFLVDRLDDFELDETNAKEMCRQYLGFVEPAVARLQMALTAPPPVAAQSGEAVEGIITLATAFGMAAYDAGLWQSSSADAAERERKVSKYDRLKKALRDALSRLSPSPIASEPKDAGSGEGQDIAEQAAQFLWSLLDDIDTLSDHVKADNVTYREIAERIQRRRFEVGDTDGYTVTFKRKAEIRTAPSGTKP